MTLRRLVQVLLVVVLVVMVMRVVVAVMVMVVLCPQRWCSRPRGAAEGSSGSRISGLASLTNRYQLP